MQYVLARMRSTPWSRHHTAMLGAHDLPPLNLEALPPEAAAWIARWQHAEQQLALRDQALVERDLELVQARSMLQRRDRDIACPMTRIGEDMSERLDIVPAEFFMHRQIYGKWACRCCQVLRQAPSMPELIEGGMAASGLIAHTLGARATWLAVQRDARLPHDSLPTGNFFAEEL